MATKSALAMPRAESLKVVGKYGHSLTRADVKTIAEHLPKGTRSEISGHYYVNPRTNKIYNVDKSGKVGEFLGYFRPEFATNPQDILDEKFFYWADEEPSTELEAVEKLPSPADSLIMEKLLLRIPNTVKLNEDLLRDYYHKRALRIHPDRNPGKDTTEMFQKVQNAYEKLLLALK